MGFGVSENGSVMESMCEHTVVEPARELESSQVSCASYVELRQRNVNGSVGDEPGNKEIITRESSIAPWRPESKGNISKLEKEGPMDWNRVILEDPRMLGEVSSSNRSPIKYFIREIDGGIIHLEAQYPLGMRRNDRGGDLEVRWKEPRAALSFAVAYGEGEHTDGNLKEASGRVSGV